jgi:hypothetical protein
VTAAQGLAYEKYGTRIAACDEGDERLQRFAFDGAKALAEAKGWEILSGPVERVPVGAYDGDEIFAYLWPVARTRPASGGTS